MRITGCTKALLVLPFIMAVTTSNTPTCTNSTSTLSSLTLPSYAQGFDRFNVVDLLGKSRDWLTNQTGHLCSVASLGVKGIDDLCTKDIVYWSCNLNELLVSTRNLSATHLVTTDNLWYLQVLDSWSKLPSGVLEGNVQWAGAYDQCAHIRHNIDDGQTQRSFTTQHCTATIQPPVSKQVKIKMALCVPSTCSGSDIRLIYSALLPDNSTDATQLLFDCETDGVKPFQHSIAATCLACLVLSLAVIGTVLDHTINTNIKKLLGIQCLLAFSVTSNGGKILSTKQSASTMQCLHGIRAISMLWVMYGHTYFFVMRYLPNPLIMLNLPHYVLFMFINNATVSVDTFFMLSGFLVSFLFLKKVATDRGKHEIRKVQFWIMYYVHRYVRLTPVYMTVILLSYSFWNYIGDGPFWQARDDMPVLGTCQGSWWKNALYIQNMWGFYDQCIGWTWYLANDMQFYWISPPILVALAWYPKTALSICTLLIVGCNVARGVVSSTLDLSPTMIYTTDLNQSLSLLTNQYATVMYEKPWFRIAPYLIGIIFGYIMFRMEEKKLQLRKIHVLVAWTITLAVGLSVIYSLYPYASTGHITPLFKVIYASVNRSIWAMFVAAVVFLCLKGYGGPINSVLSWCGWLPVSRLAYCSYLIHELVLEYLYGTQRVLEVQDNYLLFIVFLQTAVFTFIGAFVLSILFESPIIQLEKILLHPAPRVKPQSQQLTTLTEHIEKPVIIRF